LQDFGGGRTNESTPAIQPIFTRKIPTKSTLDFNTGSSRQSIACKQSIRISSALYLVEFWMRPKLFGGRVEMIELPASVSFSGHETFPFRYTWLKKGLDAIVDDEAVFVQDEAMTRLGVGKNMVRSIRHWCLAAGVIDEYQPDLITRSAALRPSNLGKKLFADDGWDPYLEDPATLWLIHWNLASNARRATTWNWAFSYVFEPEFTKESLLASLEHWAETNDYKRIAASSLKRDIEVFIRTYVPSRQSHGAVVEDTLDCPLVELNLIREAGDRQTYQFNRGRQSDLPTGILLYAVLDFWKRSADANETISLHDLAYQPGSPGRLFQIDEDSFAARLDEMETWTGRKVIYGETAGIKQLYRMKETSPFDLLEKTYAGSRATAGGARRG
jgi:hypothetical protein